MAKVGFELTTWDYDAELRIATIPSQKPSYELIFGVYGLKSDVIFKELLSTLTWIYIYQILDRIYKTTKGLGDI